MGEPRIEKKHLGLALVNGCCDRPHAYVRGAAWRFKSEHGHDKHPLDLTAEDLRRMADELERNCGTTLRASEQTLTAKASPCRGQGLQVPTLQRLTD